jgi:post-segregation antitoxin (ccd killing protein)
MPSPRHKQFRRTVSFRPEVYVRLKRQAEAAGICITTFTENAIEDALRKAGQPEVTREEAIAELRPPKTRPETVDEHIGTHFTF